MNLTCISQKCRSLFSIQGGKGVLTYHCASGFDHDKDSDRGAFNCGSYVEGFICLGGLHYAKAEFTADTCRECLETCQSTGCPKHEAGLYLLDADPNRVPEVANEL
jgi:hypothetical protein